MFGRSKQCTKTRGGRAKELRRDVLPRRLVGGRREGEDLDVAERLAGAGERAVFGAEIVPPLRHAMRLVDGEPADAGVAQARGQAPRPRAAPARRRAGGARSRAASRQVSRASSSPVAELSVAAATPKPRICRTWSRISAISGETTTVSAAVDDRRQLVAHRLAAAGRHDGEHVLAGEHRGDDLGLAGAEIVVAEDRSSAARAAASLSANAVVRARRQVDDARASEPVVEARTSLAGVDADLDHDGEAGEPHARARRTRARVREDSPRLGPGRQAMSGRPTRTGR